MEQISSIKMPALQDDVGDVKMSLNLELIMDEKVEAAMVKYGENDSTRTSKLEELKEKIYERGEMTPLRMDDDYLLRFLRSRNFKVEPAFNLLRNYCQFRDDNIHYYQGMNLLELLNVGECKILNVLPYKEQNGRRIIIFKIANWNTSELELEEIFKAAVGMLEAGILEPTTQILGGVGLFDMEGLSMQHALYFTPSVVSKIQQILSTSFPMKIASIHIVNESWGFEQIFKLFKPFLSPRYEETIHFHGSNMSSLHKFIEPKYLPQEYGGIRPEYNYVEWFVGLSKQDNLVEAMRELGYVVKVSESLEEKVKNYS